MADDIRAVREFWEKNPLFQGESNYHPGTREFFEEHRRVYIEDCFAGSLESRLFPDSPDGLVLDLGCGPGFWIVEFVTTGKARNIVASDLTHNALEITRQRLVLHDIDAGLVQANAEMLPFTANTFSHVNCHGVIHHTPETEKCIIEIERVLKVGGSALISVYYLNVFLRHWEKLRWFGFVLANFGAGLRGRGRENIFRQVDINEIVRSYDGTENPLGKVYSKIEFESMIKKHFEIEELFFHFFQPDLY